MKIILSVAMIFCFSLANAQRISYFELHKILYADLAMSNDLLTEKGFSFRGIDTLSNNPSVYSYNFSKNSRYSDNYIGIDKWRQNGIFYEVSLFTMKLQDYNAVKNYVKLHNFKLLETETSEDGKLRITYSNKIVEISFMSGIKKADDYSQYYISLKDIRLSRRAQLDN